MKALGYGATPGRDGGGGRGENDIVNDGAGLGGAGGADGAGGAGGGGGGGGGGGDMGDDRDGGGEGDGDGDGNQGQWGGLSAANGVNSGPAGTLGGMYAEKLYLDAKANGGLPYLKPGDKTRAQIVCLWFDAMATKEEHKTLSAKPDDNNPCKLVVNLLHNLVKVRLREAYTEAGMGWPRVLLPNNDAKQAGRLKAGSMEQHQIDLRKKGKVMVDILTLGAWRKAHEAPPPTEPSSPKSPKSPKRQGMFALFGG